jgi:hypothetical protein
MNEDFEVLNEIPCSIKEWCDRHNWTDPQCVDRHWYAFPPNGVMPIALPFEALKPIEEPEEPYLGVGVLPVRSRRWLGFFV